MAWYLVQHRDNFTFAFTLNTWKVVTLKMKNMRGSLSNISGGNKL
jgi:hypothetical protein